MIETHAGGRYGVWGINPYGMPIKRTPGIETAIKTAEGIGNLFAKRYANQENEAKARLAQQTVDSEIAAKNARNQADTLFYPQQQEAKLGQEKATIKEIMARTGASHAQAQHMLASARAEDARTRLIDMQAFGAGAPYLKGVSAGGLRNLFPSIGGAFEVNPLQAGSRGGFHQAVTTDKNGNPITIESPTMASATRNQSRKEAEAESGTIAPKVLQGINNYQSAFPTFSLLQDTLVARGKGKKADEAKKRLEEYALARRFVPEMTAINARQATGQPPGIEVLREFQESMFPNLPRDFAAGFIPADIKVNAANNYPALQRSLAESAINQEREGYPQEGVPAWAANANVQQEPQTNQAAQLSTWAEEAIARGADPAAVRARLQQLQGGG